MAWRTGKKNADAVGDATRQTGFVWLRRYVHAKIEFSGRCCRCRLIGRYLYEGASPGSRLDQVQMADLVQGARYSGKVNAELTRDLPLRR